MADETTRKPPADPEQPTPPASNDPGRLAADDRGNMTWEWANDAVLQADDTAGAIERLRALVDPNLDLVEDELPNSPKHNPKGLITGYDPYDSGELGKTARRKKLNLRELSKWIDAKRKSESSGDPEE